MLTTEGGRVVGIEERLFSEKGRVSTGSQKTENRNQKSEIRDQKTEIRERRLGEKTHA